MPKVGAEPIRRAQVIGAVFGQMAESGLEGLTMDRVAARAGVSKGVVTYYFKTKKRLLLESFRTILESYNQEIMSRIDPDMPASEVAGVIIAATLRSCQTGEEPPGVGGPGAEPWSADQEGIFRPPPDSDDCTKVLFHFYQMAGLDDDFRRVAAEVFQGFLECTTEVIRDGIERGEFGPADPRETAYALLAMLDGILLHRAIGFRPLSLERAEKICRRQVENLRA